MIVHNSERLDNLEGKLLCNSIAMECSIVGSSEATTEVMTTIASLSAIRDSQRQNLQSDLYYLNSILVSAGWNKNDDVFDVADLWSAKDTPVDKPFNYMHDDSDIIGHMIASIAVAEDGTILESDPLPDRIDLITSAVIYKVWSDPDQRARVAGLIDRIDKGELAVSMECIFKNFDYAIIAPNGEEKVLARSEDSAFLTKHLRAYGGTGEYDGHKIGRLLRDLYFTGKGLVDKPANPRSIILPKDVNPFGPVKAEDNFILTAMEVEMPEENTALSAELEIAKANVTTLTDEVNTHKSCVATLEARVIELEQSIAAINLEKMALSQELQTMVAKSKAMQRKTALMTAGADEVKASELCEKFASATDEMFESVVALIVPVTVATVETVSEDADLEALETVVDVETPIVDLSDTTSDKIQTASAWLRDSVLKTTQSKSKGS